MTNEPMISLLGVVFDDFLQDAANVAAANKNVLNRHGVLSRLLVNEVVVEVVDDLEPKTGVTCFTAGTRFKL